MSSATRSPTCKVFLMQGQPESLLGIVMHIMQLGSQASLTPAQSPWLPPCLASSRKLISAGGGRM